MTLLIANIRVVVSRLGSRKQQQQRHQLQQQRRRRGSQIPNSTVYKLHSNRQQQQQ